MKHWPKIPLGLRLFLLFFVVVAMTAYFVTDTMIDEIKPTVRQVTEETLVDMANLLAVMAADDLKKDQLSTSRFGKLLNLYGKRQPQAVIWDVDKKSINHRIYVTDHKGIVVADSWQQDIGSDFSRWNDVYLTLRGQYGARSSTDPYDPDYTVMHVAAPVMDGQTIIGSVTVAKANRSVQPFIDLTKRRVLTWLGLMSVMVLILGALVAWRVNLALYRLADYGEKMGRGEKAQKPTFRVFYEYAALSDALEKLRDQLDGKDYVEQYVQTLTHELKSPLSAIKGAGEILQNPLDEDKRALFTGNIAQETSRMEQLIERLLCLAKVEKQACLQEVETLKVASLMTDVLAALSVKAEQKQVIIEKNIPEQSICCERFLLQQALINILDNALDFVFIGGEITIDVVVENNFVRFDIYNQGPLIPDYALPRLTERFYSLARENGVKSTGLGLNFVEQVAKLHQGSLTVGNLDNGVLVSLSIKSP